MTEAPTAPTVTTGRDLPIGERGVEILDAEAMRQVCQWILRAGIAPPDMRDPSKLAIAIQLGMELGLPWLQAIQNIAVINGRPSIWGKLGRALVLRSGKLVMQNEHFIGTPFEDDFTAVCILVRRDIGGEFLGEFSVDDAKRMGVWGKGTYQKDPKGMLRWRAWWRAADAGFADFLKGAEPRELATDFEPRIAEAHEVSMLDELLPAPRAEEPAAEPQPEPEADPDDVALFRGIQ